MCLNGQLHDFYPRSPCGERPVEQVITVLTIAFLSTLSLRRATPGTSVFRGWTLFLSTLSLRRATRERTSIKPIFSISIHALLAESDRSHRRDDRSPVHFYPRSPCGERPSKRYPVILGRVISIHALLAESDVDALELANLVLFLSTLSLRRATARRASRQHPAGISIHALLAESDRLCTILYSCPGNFYPRSPCGERLHH